MKDGPCSCDDQPLGPHPCGCGRMCVRFWRYSDWQGIAWSPPVHLGGVHWRLECVLRLARKHLGQDALACESIRREVRAATNPEPERAHDETPSLFARLEGPRE